MHAAILYDFDSVDDVDTLPSSYDGFPAAGIEATQYLDGRTIFHGTLAGRITEETSVPVVGEDFITTEREEVERRRSTDVYIDPDGGWGGIDSSAGESLFVDYCASTTGVIPEAASIDTVGFAEHLPDDVETNGIVYSQSIEDGHGRDAAGAHWHQDANPTKIPTEGCSALSVTYTWDGGLVDAMIAASGYVAVYREWSVDQFARWVAEEIQPYCYVEDEFQETLAADVCEECGRESDGLQRAGGKTLCPVCRDKRDEEGVA